MNPIDKLNLGSTATTATTSWTGLSREQMLENIQSAMTKLREMEDPLKQFFQRQGINVDTHDVYINNCHKGVLTSPPAYIKFSTAVDPKGYLAVERIDNNLLVPKHERGAPWWLSSDLTKVKK